MDEVVEWSWEGALWSCRAGSRITRQFQASERLVDLVDIERGGPQCIRFEVIAIEAGELGDRVGMCGMPGIGGRRYQLIGTGPTAVLRRAIPPPGNAHCSRCGGGLGEDRFEPDGVLPAVTE